MLIRKHHKNEKWPLWVIVILILAVVFYKYHSYLWNINRNKKNLQEIDYTNIQWTIEKLEKIWYSEYFLKNNKSRLLLKNYPKNIDNLIWKNVIIQWESKTIGKDQIFLIKSLKDLDNNIFIEDENYLFANDLLILNAKQIPWLIINIEWDKIIIYYQNSPLVNISTFGCSKISTSRNCKNMIDDFESNENEYFNSYNWIVYYKLQENKWNIFNDLFLWYYFETQEDKTLLNISSIINIINSDYVRYNKKSLVTNYCKELLSIDDINIIWKEWNILIVNATWKDKDKKKSECNIKFDLMDQRKII